ncbi:MAG: hypothetical protein QOE92_2360 [Chloroflexota bacterium]|nr:hypothetical protein [Chloroflexota bacterium]
MSSQEPAKRALPRSADGPRDLAPRLDGLEPALRRRVELALSCDDVATLPKVAGAGTTRAVGGVEVQVMHDGTLVQRDAYQGPWMTELIRCLRGHHEPQEELVFARILERLDAAAAPRSMIELGSWWAYYSLWFKRRFPDATVVAMEPDPAYLEVGRRNFELNDMPGTFVQGVIGTATGPSLPFRCESDGIIRDVPQHSLESLLELAEVEQVSLVLADIQGAETALLEQAEAPLRSGRVRFLTVSTHHHSISGDALTHQSVLATLRELGAHVIAEHSVGESFTGDGLVAVSFDPADRDLVVPLSRARQRESVFGELEPDLAAAQADVRRLQEDVERLEDDVRRADARAAAMARTRAWRWAERLRRLATRAGRPAS